MRLQVGYRLLDNAQIVFQSRLQHFFYMQGPGFSKNGANRGMGVDQGFDIGIIFGSPFHATGRAEGSDESVLPLHILGTFEKFNIFRIGARPATLNEGYSEIVELLRDTDLIIPRKSKTFRLGSIPECGVVDLYLLHRSFHSEATANPEL